MSRLIRLTLGLVLTAGACEAQPATGPSDEAAAPARQSVRAKVILVPLREFPDDLMLAVEQGLRDELDVEVVRHEPVTLPEDAYYAPRKRYRAEKLLVFLDGFVDEARAAGESGNIKILGLTEVDISTSADPYPDWGIFGLGRTPGEVAVISSKRLKRRAKNREHVRFRVSTTAIHEIGHTFGLPHCDEQALECVMIDAEGGIENTDASSGKLGPGCRMKLDYLAPPGP